MWPRKLPFRRKKEESTAVNHNGFSSTEVEDSHNKIFVRLWVFGNIWQFDSLTWLILIFYSLQQICTHAQTPCTCSICCGLSWIVMDSFWICFSLARWCCPVQWRILHFFAVGKPVKGLYIGLCSSQSGVSACVVTRRETLSLRPLLSWVMVSVIFTHEWIFDKRVTTARRQLFLMKLSFMGDECQQFILKENLLSVSDLVPSWLTSSPGSSPSVPYKIRHWPCAAVRQ